MTNCPKCQKEIKGDEMYCPHCGGTVRAVPELSPKGKFYIACVVVSISVYLFQAGIKGNVWAFLVACAACAWIAIDDIISKK